jgi:hypothetical protein
MVMHMIYPLFTQIPRPKKRLSLALQKCCHPESFGFLK